MEAVTEQRNFAPLAQRCAAKSKRSQKPCRNPAIAGVDKCRMHGGTVQGRPSGRTSTHGLAKQYVHKDELPGILETMRQLDSPEGRAEALKQSYAWLTQRLANVPDHVDFLEMVIKALDSRRKDVALVQEIEVGKDANPQLPNYTIINGNAACQTFEARSADGHCTVKIVDGMAYMLDAATGALWPASLRKDEESGAEFYERLLVAKAD